MKFYVSQYVDLTGAKRIARALAIALMNGVEGGELPSADFEANYEGSGVDSRVYISTNLKNLDYAKLKRTLLDNLKWMENACKNGWGDDTAEDILDTYQSEDEEVINYTNVRGDDPGFSVRDIVNAYNSVDYYKWPIGKAEALSILKKAGKSVKPSHPLAADNLEGFFEDLNAALDRVGLDPVEDFDEFEEELNGMGSAHLFNVASDDEYEAWEEENGSGEGYSDHYFDIAEKYISKVKRELSRKWSGFEIDSDKDDTQIFVTLIVDGMGDEL